MIFGWKKQVVELEKANTNLNRRLQEWEDGWSETQRKVNQVEYLVRTIRDMDEQIYKMAQCTSWGQMQPIFENLLEGTMARKRTESDRIGELISTEIVKSYQSPSQQTGDKL